MALNDYDVFISQSPRGGRLCENQRMFTVGSENLFCLTFGMPQSRTSRRAEVFTVGSENLFYLTYGMPQSRTSRRADEK